MKLKLKEEFDDTKWHHWYAWYPIIIHTRGDRYFIWLEEVMRRKIYAAMSSFSEYRFHQSSSAFCKCSNELLGDEKSKVYETGTVTNIICSKCNLQTTWDLGAPVPLFIKSKI